VYWIIQIPKVVVVAASWFQSAGFPGRNNGDGLRRRYRLRAYSLDGDSMSGSHRRDDFAVANGPRNGGECVDALGGFRSILNSVHISY
jgi:hypothetical protein